MPSFEITVDPLRLRDQQAADRPPRHRQQKVVPKFHVAVSAANLQREYSLRL
jgi:hypothetical protein